MKSVVTYYSYFSCLLEGTYNDHLLQLPDKVWENRRKCYLIWKREWVSKACHDHALCVVLIFEPFSSSLLIHQHWYCTTGQQHWKPYSGISITNDMWKLFLTCHIHFWYKHNNTIKPPIANSLWPLNISVTNFQCVVSLHFTADWTTCYFIYFHFT